MRRCWSMMMIPSHHDDQQRPPTPEEARQKAWRSSDKEAFLTFGIFACWGFRSKTLWKNFIVSESPAQGSLLLSSSTSLLLLTEFLGEESLDKFFPDQKASFCIRISVLRFLIFRVHIYPSWSDFIFLTRNHHVILTIFWRFLFKNQSISS